jgi:hypothetical protein
MEIYKIKEPEPLDIERRIGYFIGAEGLKHVYTDLVMDTYYEHIMECFLIMCEERHMRSRERKTLIKNCRMLFDVLESALADGELYEDVLREIGREHRYADQAGYAVVDGKLRYITMQDMWPSESVGYVRVLYGRKCGKLPSDVIASNVNVEDVIS